MSIMPAPRALVCACAAVVALTATAACDVKDTGGGGKSAVKGRVVRREHAESHGCPIAAFDKCAQAWTLVVRQGRRMVGVPVSHRVWGLCTPGTHYPACLKGR